jgi:protein-L-isoaspartate O-methyltransferase
MRRAILAWLLAAGTAASSAAQTQSLAPYLPTPDDVVARMLRLAKVGPEDVVYDLGSGDGRIVIAAARDFGARGVGIEIDPDLVAKANARAAAAGVAGRVTFRAEDVRTANLREATVVTLYLLAASNVTLRPILTRQLRAGTRIVAHDFPIGTWQPDVADTFSDTAGRTRTLFLWVFDGEYRP